MFGNLDIRSPKRSSRATASWEGFFPYYAGYPEDFTKALLASAELESGALVFDPWNGSGTTTYVASELGIASQGYDLNPVMIVVARARLLSASEADSIEPLASDVVSFSRPELVKLQGSEPLRAWFSDRTAASIRAVERSIAKRLLGRMTITSSGTNLSAISGFAATFYVALFAVCRQLAAPFQTSNPTWLRFPKQDESLIDIPHREVAERFLVNLRKMGATLAEQAENTGTERGPSRIRLADTTCAAVKPKSVDFVLTSPPYCTRIDYTAATRIELAVMKPLNGIPPEELSHRMIGSIRVPRAQIQISPSWGPRCITFLNALRQHPSKASGTYYFNTHLDYFDKMARSIERVASALKLGGRAILVVQDSYYKEIHNDLPTILTEIAEAHGLQLKRREDFHIRRSMAGINPRSRVYKRNQGVVEAVLCFQKSFS